MAQALEAAEGDKWTLEGQKTEMLRQQQRHLAWSGQALIANSVSVMEEAVDQIRATFLFTSKELKCASCITTALDVPTWSWPRGSEAPGEAFDLDVPRKTSHPFQGLQLLLESSMSVQELHPTLR